MHSIVVIGHSCLEQEPGLVLDLLFNTLDRPSDRLGPEFGPHPSFLEDVNPSVKLVPQEPLAWFTVSTDSPKKLYVGSLVCGFTHHKQRYAFSAFCASVVDSSRQLRVSNEEGIIRLELPEAIDVPAVGSSGCRSISRLCAEDEFRVALGFAHKPLNRSAFCIIIWKNGTTDLAVKTLKLVLL